MIKAGIIAFFLHILNMDSKDCNVRRLVWNFALLGSYYHVSLSSLFRFHTQPIYVTSITITAPFGNRFQQTHVKDPLCIICPTTNSSSETIGWASWNTPQLKYHKGFHGHGHPKLSERRLAGRSAVCHDDRARCVSEPPVYWTKNWSFNFKRPLHVHVGKYAIPLVMLWRLLRCAFIIWT